MRFKKVKVIATLGPSSDSAEVIKKLADEGVDVFRINLSHARHDDVSRIVTNIRACEKEIGRPLTIMADLAGPKIRLGNIQEGTILANGQLFKIVKEEVLGNHEIASINYPSIIKQLQVGSAVYIDDGQIQLEVTENDGESVTTKVVVGGHVKPYKGFYAEGISLDLHGLSEKDKKDVEFLAHEEIDALAISFVQHEEDINNVREFLPRSSKLFIVSKIETAQAIENIDSIIAVSDAVMVARGDLGLAVPIAEVPHLQKRLIALCLAAAKPVIIATQMLESMNNNPIPTRAEVTDVANAILDGTDAVMLSGETATGNFPVETVRMMVKIITRAVPHVVPRYYSDEHTINGSISNSVGEVATQINAKLVIVFTQTGSSARLISRHRHSQLLLALSPLETTLRRLNFSFGVHPLLIRSTVDLDNMKEQARALAAKNDVLKLQKDDSFVIAAGMQFGKTGSTNMILVEKL